MPTNKADTKHIVEGRYEDVARERLIYGDAASSLTKQTFVRMVILEVIHDPGTLDRAKLSMYEHDLGVSNISYALTAPRNSVIARPAMRQGAGAHERVMVLYPFFPPHLALPARPGEHVWAIFENPNAPVNEIGYWMCRVTQPNFVEDANYTHADRQGDPSFMPGLSDQFNGSDEPVYELRNGAVDSKDGSRYTLPGTATLPGSELAYETLRKETDASQIIQYEHVPRFRKRPADVALEGSNNTLIVLGTDRAGPSAVYDTDTARGAVPKPAPGDVFDVGAGCIDVVVGRGQTPVTAGRSIETKAVSGGVLGKELAKAKKQLSVAEGDPDLLNDRSRVLVAQKTRADKNFLIDKVINKHVPGTVDDTAEGAIVIKTDKLRLIARQDVVILVSGATERDANGNIKDPGEVDPSQCASVVLKANGDIIFTPATRGVLKLGGDDANLAVMCGIAVTGVGDGTGAVTAAPIIDTMGGAEGQGGPSGQFATKVLLK